MTNSGRPLSPHLSVFRWPITMALSILHRVTGVAMSVGLVVYAIWLMAAAGSPGLYGWLNDFFGSLIGQLFLIGWSFAFFLHLANGVRHLVWDTGRGIDRASANSSGWFIVVATVVVTGLFWVLR
jgi:succinate dehydrogenase / fumarate reductase cytochrome b subunit